MTQPATSRVTTPAGTSARDWDERQQAMGCTPRAVLFKRFPGWMNSYVHRRHQRFVVRHLPARPRRVLDVCCGYGRLAEVVHRERPKATIEGVEACAAFADHFEKHFGPCHRVFVQEFRPEHSYDAILLVTALMYLGVEDLTGTIRRLWGSLTVGGRIICIEPAIEVTRTANWIFRRKRLAGPTSGVRQFTSDELLELLSSDSQASIVGRESIRLVPAVKATTLHHCIAVEKNG